MSPKLQSDRIILNFKILQMPPFAFEIKSKIFTTVCKCLLSWSSLRLPIQPHVLWPSCLFSLCPHWIRNHLNFFVQTMHLETLVPWHIPFPQPHASPTHYPINRISLSGLSVVLSVLSIPPLPSSVSHCPITYCIIHSPSTGPASYYISLL